MSTPAADAGDVRRLQARLDRVTHERNCLGEAIADAAYKAGVYSGKPVTGPELILLVREMANVIVGAELEWNDLDTRGEMAVVDGEEAE